MTDEIQSQPAEITEDAPALPPRNGWGRGREIAAVLVVVAVAVSNILFFLSQYQVLIVHRRKIVEIIDPRDLDKVPEGHAALVENAPGTTIEATSFDAGNLNRQPNHFGMGIVIDGGVQPGHAMWRFTPDESGPHDLWILYATGEPRPMRVTCNGRMVARHGANLVTGGFTSEYLRWSYEGTAILNAGRVNTLQVRAESFVPNLRKFKFIPTGTVPVPGTDEISESPE